MTTVTYYDPPGGWAFGFPRVYKPRSGETIDQTLIRDGFPKANIVEGVLYCRFWQENENLTLADLTGQRLVYVATPYTHHPDGHAVAALEAAKACAALMRRGLCAISPIAHRHAVATAGDLDLVDGDFWQRQDAPLVEAASACVVITMPGWEESRGVKHEIAEFRSAGKPVVFVDPEELG